VKDNGGCRIPEKRGCEGGEWRHKTESKLVGQSERKKEKECDPDVVLSWKNSGKPAAMRALPH